MQNPGPQSNTGRATSKEHHVPKGEQMGTDDTQSEFSVNQARQAAVQEQNEQRQQADANKQESRMSAQAPDTQSEFSVAQRLREDQKK